MKIILIIFTLISSIASYGQVSLNEMQSSNNSTIADNMGEYDDWIEIYNPTLDAIEIGGLVLKDQLDTWTIPTGDPSTLLAPGAYFMLWADDEESQGIFHTNFKLASGGEFLGLYEMDGSTVIDSLTIPALNEDESYMRCNDEWFQSSNPTPLNMNDCSVDIQDQTLEDNTPIITISGHQMTIEFNNLNANQVTFHLHAIDGKELMHQSINQAKTSVSLNELQTGIYIVNILGQHSKTSKKIIILQ